MESYKIISKLYFLALFRALLRVLGLLVILFYLSMQTQPLPCLDTHVNTMKSWNFWMKFSHWFAGFCLIGFWSCPMEATSQKGIAADVSCLIGESISETWFVYFALIAAWIFQRSTQAIFVHCILQETHRWCFWIRSLMEKAVGLLQSLSIWVLAPAWKTGLLHWATPLHNHGLARPLFYKCVCSFSRGFHAVRC